MVTLLMANFFRKLKPYFQWGFKIAKKTMTIASKKRKFVQENKGFSR